MLLFLLWSSPLAAEVAGSLTVQGRVDTPGASLTGTASILDGGAPTDFNLVPIPPTTADANGVFDMTLVGMSSATFAGSGPFILRLVIGADTLDIPLDSVSFAFRAAAADTLSLGSPVLAEVVALNASTITLSAQLAQVAVDTTALRAQFAQVGVDTASLQGQFAQVAVDTTALQAQLTQVGVDTSTLQGRFAQVAVDTTALQAQFAQIAVDTTALQVQFVQVGVDTAALSVGLAQVGIDTATLQGKLAQVGLATSTLRTDVDAKVAKAGDTMTGPLNLNDAAINLTGSNGNIVSQASITASAFFGDGSGLTGIGGGGGATSDPGDVVLNADSDSNGSGLVSLRTAGQERMQVANAGNVGVLGASPTSLPFGFPAFNLDVAGDIGTAGEVRANNLGSRTAGLTLNSRSGGGFGLPACGITTVFMDFQRNGSSVMRLANTTCVGISFSVSGTKSFTQDHPTDSTKIISYYSLEGPEAGTYVRGSAQLVGGEATIALPEHFTLVTSTSAALTAQLTPLEECNGIFVISKDTTELRVKELGGGTSGARFDYFVQGVRAGKEAAPVVQDKDDMLFEQEPTP